MTPQEREEFEDRPTNTALSTSKYLALGVNQTYAAIRRGEIPSVRIGAKILVPTRPLLRMLGMETGVPGE